MRQAEWDRGAQHPMQGWGWGEFRLKMGNGVSRIRGDNQYQIIWSKINFTPWWFGYIPMGPIPTEGDLGLMRLEARRMGAVGVRMEPCALRASMTNDQFSIFNRYLKPGRKLFKSKTYWVDLRKSEEELLAGMTPKCRYNIRLAQRHGVEVREDGKVVDDYLRLMFGNTTRRQRIYSHGERYHQELARQDFVRLFAAEWRGKVVATWMVFVWMNFIYYAYGAFDDGERDKMAPALGLWEIIRWTKRRGYKTLDLWGVEEGRGFSRFKEQFGPQLVEMVGTYDLPVNKPLYWVFRAAEEIRWKILRMCK